MNRLGDNRAVSWFRAHWRTIGIAAAGVIVLFGVVGYFAIPAAARWGIETVASRELGRSVTVEKISANPYSLRVTLNGLAIAGHPGETPLLTVRQATVNASLMSALRLVPVIDALSIDGLAAHLIRLEAQRFNFSDIIERLRARPKTSDEPTPFAVYNIEVTNSAIDLDDRVLNSRHALTDIALGIPFISSLDTHSEITVQPAFAARIDGTPIELKGETRPFHETLESSINLKLDDLDIPKYLSYSPLKLNFEVGSGTLDTDLQITFRRAAPAREDRPATPAQLLVTGSIDVNGLAMAAPAGSTAQPLIGWKSLRVAIDEIGLLAGRAVIGDVALTAPVVRLERDASGQINWARFLQQPLASLPAAESGTAAPGGGPAPRPFALTIRHATVSDGRVDYSDELIGRFRQELIGVNAEATGLTTTSTAAGKVRVSATIKDNGGVALVGEVGLAPVAGRLHLAARDVKLLVAARYLTQVVDASIDGQSDVDGVLEFGPGESGNRLALREVKVAGRGIKVRGPSAGGAALDIATLGLEGGEIDLPGRTITIGKLALDAPRVVVRRLSDGVINWTRIVNTKSATTTAQTEASAPAAWQVRLKQAEVARGELQFEDVGVEPAVKLRATALSGTARDVVGDGSERAEFTLRTRFGSGGTLAASGGARWDTLAANIRLDARNLDVGALRPYFAKHLNAVLARAEFSSRGIVNLSQGGKESPLRVAFNGSARLGNLHALDASGENDLLKWQLMDVDKITVKTGEQPPFVELGKVSLSDFYARVIVSEQGRLNLADLVKREATTDSAAASRDAPIAPKPDADAGSLPVDRETAVADTKTAQTTVSTVAPTESAEPRPTIRIAQVELVRGNVNFTDNFIKPNYTANMTGLGGTMSTLASDNAEPATLALSGRIDDEAPLEISGRLNPLAPKLFLDIEGRTKGVDLPRLTPYSVKYAGYPIVKGKLSMEVKYKVEDQKLTASNHLFLDQLTFGDKVESPTATKLPVLLAVSLLKNTRGEIDINLPISGSLNDPKFSMGGIIVQVIVNLLTKIVTAPFALLAAAFGGGEELGYIEFAPGSSVLAAEQQKRLETLAKALNDRPALRLDIIGRVDPAADTEGVKRAKYDSKLKAAKVRQTVRAGGDSIDPAKITISDAEKPALIAAVYSDEEIPNKPRNVIGFAKTIPAPEMEQLILANLSVAPEDLRALANQRASVVRNHLENEGKVGRERLFLVEPKLTPEGIQDKGAKTRVDFSLK